MNNGNNKRQQLICMCCGQMPEGTMQPINGGSEWRLFMANGITIDGTKNFLQELWQSISSNAL